MLNDSLIITNESDVVLINSWIAPNKNISYNLIYRASRDGDTENDFHRNCDNIAPTLVLGITPKRYIFGGYTTVNWNYCSGKYLPDSEAFVFSINQKRKFHSNDKIHSVQSISGYCTIFGNGSNSLQIENNILTSNNHWSNPNGSYGSNLNLTEDKNFSIKEFEIFQVIIN